MEGGQREFKLRDVRIIFYTRADDRYGVWKCRRRLVRRSTKATDLAEESGNLRGKMLETLGLLMEAVKVMLNGEICV